MRTIILKWQSKIINEIVEIEFPIEAFNKAFNEWKTLNNNNIKCSIGFNFKS